MQPLLCNFPLMRESYPAYMGTFSQLNNALEELVAAIKADAERPQEPAVAALLAGVGAVQAKPKHADGTAQAQGPSRQEQGAQDDKIEISSEPPRGLREHVRRHWPEYLMEGGELGIFMISACLFGALLFHPMSPVVAAVPTLIARRLLMGLAMGLTSMAIVYSPWGKQSGAHFNPSVSITFFRLGK